MNVPGADLLLGEPESTTTISTGATVALELLPVVENDTAEGAVEGISGGDCSRSSGRGDGLPSASCMLLPSIHASWSIACLDGVPLPSMGCGARSPEAAAVDESRGCGCDRGRVAHSPGLPSATSPVESSAHPRLQTRVETGLDGAKGGEGDPSSIGIAADPTEWSAQSLGAGLAADCPSSAILAGEPRSSFSISAKLVVTP